MTGRWRWRGGVMRGVWRPENVSWSGAACGMWMLWGGGWKADLTCFSLRCACSLDFEINVCCKRLQTCNSTCWLADWGICLMSHISFRTFTSPFKRASFGIARLLAVWQPKMNVCGLFGLMSAEGRHGAWYRMSGGGGGKRWGGRVSGV